MRQAYIGDDGRIYDADGHLVDKPKKRAIPNSAQHRPMMSNGRRVRGAFFRGIGQASVDVAPPPQASLGVAYRTAVRVAIPLQGFSWSRDGGSPSNQVYPGRLVVSARYPGNLFRVAFRPPTDNNQAMTRLAILEGTGAGSYIEVPIQPDGSTSPSLLGSFSVVPGDAYLQVEYSINPSPVPQVDGGEWRASFPWIYQAIDQAAFLSTSFNETTTPIEWGNASSNAFVTIAAALGFVVDGIDMIGWAYDFGRIGDKELKILTKIGGDIFVKVSNLYELLNPSSQNTVFRSSDENKIEAFQKKVDEMTALRPYWSVMLGRALLYNQQTEIASAWMGYQMFDTGIGWAENSIERIQGLRPEIMTSVAGQVPEDQLNANLDALSARYQATSDGLSQNQETFKSQWKSAFPGVSLGGLYTYVSLYNLMLAENAELCMQIRENVKDIVSGNLPCGDEGLSQVAASVVPAQFAAVMVGIGPGVEARRQIGEIVKSDILKAEQTWVKGGMREADAVAQARDRIAGIRKDVEKLQTALGIDRATPMGAIERPAAELQRSVTQIEDPALRAQARRALRQLDRSPEAGLRQGFDNVTNKLDEAEKLMGGPTLFETDAEKREYVERQDKAAKLISEAFTESFSLIVKTPEGKEVVADVLAQGLVTGKGELKEAQAEKIATTVMTSLVESDLFSQSSLAGLGQVVAADVGLDATVLGKSFAVTSVDLRKQADSLTQVVFEPDPHTGEDKPRTIMVSQRDRGIKLAQAERYERLAVIFASKEAAEGLLSVATKERMVRYQDVIDTAAAGGQQARANIQILAEADAALVNGDSVAKMSKSIRDTYVGEKASPENLAVMATEANKKLAAVFNTAIERLSAAIAIVKAYTGPEGKQRLATGNLSMKEVNDAIKAVHEGMIEIQKAQDAVNVALAEPTAAKRKAKVAKFLSGFYTKGITPIVEFGKKNAIAGVMALVLMGPLVFGVLWLPVQAIAWAFGRSVGNPVLWFSDVIEGMIDLLFRSRRVGDKEAEKDPNKSGSFGSGFFWTALGISMIFFGKQLFPVIGEGLKLVGSSLKTIHDLIPWAKHKKGKRGRPAEDGGERKLKGRGAPVDIDQAKEDLERARDDGDEKAEQRIISKLKKAAERGQSVPPGLWGYYWR